MKNAKVGILSLVLLTAVLFASCGPALIDGVNANEAAGAIGKSVSLVGDGSKAPGPLVIDGEEGGTVSFSKTSVSGDVTGSATFTDFTVAGDDGLIYTISGTLSLGWSYAVVSWDDSGMFPIPTAGTFSFTYSGTLTISDGNGNTTTSAIDLATSSSWAISTSSIAWTTTTTGSIGGVEVNKERSFYFSLSI